METGLRKTGISVVGDVPWGTHFCTFYETKQDLLDILVPYFKTGLESKEFCLWIVSNSELITTDEAKEALGEVVSDLDRYLAEGRIEVVSHDQWFLKNGTFDFRRVASGFKEKLDEALANGYAGLRINGGPAWIQAEDPNMLREFEQEADHYFADEHIIASCTYPLGKSRTDFLLDVARNHQFTIARRHGEWDVLEPPRLMQAKQEIQRLNEELEQRVSERTRELSEANEELRREIGERKAAEDALRRSEDRLRLVIDTVPALIHTGLSDGQLDFFNQRWLDFVGLSLEDLSGWKWTAAIHPEDLAAMVEGWRAALATGEPYEHEARVRRADGEYRLMVHREVPLRDERGSIVKWYASSIDIEDRKRAEDALRQSEERFVAFMDNLPGYAWMKDLQGRYVYVNEMVEGLPGYGSLGKTDAQIWPADLAAHYRANDKQVIATKRPLQTVEHFQLEGKQRHMVGSKFPIFDKTGAVALVGGAGVDITERIEAEAALRESEAKLKQAQQLAHIGYWERDLIADRITWSKETGRILGLESFRGVPNQAQLRQFIHPDDRQHHQQVLDEALQGNRLFDVEFRFVRPDGNIRFVHVRDEIVRDQSGKPIRMFGAVQDITGRKRAEEAVRRSEEHLRVVIDTIPTMVWTVQPDGN